MTDIDSKKYIFYIDSRNNIMFMTDNRCKNTFCNWQ